MEDILAALFSPPEPENVTELPVNATQTTTTNSTQANPLCQGAFITNTYFVYGIGPACFIVFLLGFTQKRKSACLTICGGKPGLIVPLNLLDGRSRRFSYAAAFGVTTALCISMLFAEVPVQPVGPRYLSVFFNIIAVLIYGTFFYPIFACLTVDTMLGYLLGTLWVWQYTACYTYLSFVCADSQGLAAAQLILEVPTYLCLLYLSISFPCRLFITIRRAKVPHKNSWKEHYQAKYVRRLLERPNEREKSPHLRSKVIRLIKSHIYESKPGFKYSTRVVCTFTVGFLILYMFCAGFVTFGLQLFAALYELASGFLLLNQDSSIVLLLRYLLDSNEGSIEWTVEVVLYYIYVLEICYFVSISVTAAFTCLMMANSLSNYRNNLLEMYKGKAVLPDKQRQSYSNLTAAAIRYAGYQVAYIVWAIMLQSSVLLLLTYGIACIIVIPVIYGYGDFFIQWFMNWWPGVIIVLALNYIQLLLAKLVFLQQWGRVLAIDNRNVFFIFTYYMFFFNLFVGLISCLLRILKSALIGLIFMSRLDQSSITRKYETLDPGYKSYIGLLYVEVAHTHPAMTTFCQVLIHLYLDKRDDCAVLANTRQMEPLSPYGIKRNTPVASHRAKIRWFVAYTLIHNPSLRFARKEAVDPLKEVLVNDVIPEGVHYVPCREYVPFRTSKHGISPECETHNTRM